VQSHCDDFAVVATSSTLQSIQDSLHTYKQSSSALLNSSKSFLITKHNPLSPSTFLSLSLNLYQLSIFLHTTRLCLSLCNTPAKQWLPQLFYSNLPQSSLSYSWNIPSSSITFLIALISLFSIQITTTQPQEASILYSLTFPKLHPLH